MTTEALSSVLEETTTAVNDIASDATTAQSVWNAISDGAKMELGDALMISVVGFAIVFAVLGFLAIFVFCMGKVFDILQKKKQTQKAEPVSAPAEEKKAEGYPLPDNQSIGDLTLINTTEEEAAVIMAITSDKSGIPLNRLKFNSIKLLEDDKK